MAPHDAPLIALSGNPKIDIALRRSGRARRLSLRVSRLDGKVTMTIPPFVGLDEARRFAEERHDWIRDAVQNTPATVTIGEGAEIPIEGTPHRVTLAEIRRPEIDDGVLLLPVRRPGAAAQGLLKALAQDRLAQAVDRYAEASQREVARLTLRDTRSRWGSCSADGKLMFSWRLILAPPEVLDYVAAHEVAHLKHMDHSPAFWAAVAGLCPGYDSPRRWLRQQGSALHRYRFGD